jgi:hypothetical protein
MKTIYLIFLCVVVGIIIYNSGLIEKQSTTATKKTGTVAFQDSVKDKIAKVGSVLDSDAELKRRKEEARLAAEEKAKEDKKIMVAEMTKQISFALVDAFKMKLAKGGFKLLKVFKKVMFKVGSKIAQMASQQLAKLGLQQVLRNMMKKLSSRVGFTAMKVAVQNLGRKAGQQVAQQAAKTTALVGKFSNPVSALFNGISMALDLADATGNNLTELNYANMMTNEMFYDLKIESNAEFEQGLIENGIKGNVVLSPLDKLKADEIADYIGPILIEYILNMPNASGKTNLETWISEKIAKMLENGEITEEMTKNEKYKTDENINKILDSKINDELEIFIDLEENSSFISIVTANLMNQICLDKGGILVNPDKTTYADYKGYDKYPTFNREIGVCSYTKDKCVNGIAYDKTKLMYDETKNPEPDIYGEWDGTKCKMADPTAMLNCDSMKLKYNPNKTLCKNSDCVTGLCEVDAQYCSKFGMQYITNNNISNEKKETQKDCMTDPSQDVMEFIFGSVMTRGLKNLLGIGSKQEGETCVNGAQCNGNVPGKIGTLSCCLDTKTNTKTCQTQISDWAGIGFCPSECVGKAFGKPGTCPRYEKCGVTEDDKGDGTTCTVNCERAYPNKKAFTEDDKCFTCNDEGKDPKTLSFAYERTLERRWGRDACKIRMDLGDCKYFTKKDANGKDLIPFEHHPLSAADTLKNKNKCFSCPNDPSGKSYNRTLDSIDSATACKASSCDSVYPGSSEYLVTGQCYKCPQNMTRGVIGAFDINAPNACIHNGGCNAKFPGSFEHMTTGQCYICPRDRNGNLYTRTMSAIDAPDACKAGGLTGNCSVLPVPAGINPNSVFQDGVSGNCYSCRDGVRNLNFGGSGKECSMPCPAGWERDELAGVCYRCPSGFNRNLESVWSDRSCTNGWNIFSTAKAETIPFVQSWTSVGSINAKATPIGSIVSKPDYIGSILAPANYHGSLIKPITQLQDGPMTRKKRVIEEFETKLDDKFFGIM